MITATPPRRRGGRAAGRALLAGLLGALLLAACGGPSAVTLEELALDGPSYEGEEVVTVGTVVAFDEEDGASQRHLVIEDEQQHRVRLVPLGIAEPYVGAAVEVTGRYTFVEERGRTIEVDEIREARTQG